LKIETVITCVDYADFLTETLPHNRVLFDRLVVVTAPEDKMTRRVCEFWHVQCIPTDLFETRWGRFSKGRGINVGLAELAMDGWVLHLDADIFCPPLTRKLLEQAGLDPTCLYGFDRHICRGSEAWRRYLALPQLQHESGTWIHLDKFPVGTRMMMDGPGLGYMPVGFAQLWHPRASGVFTYPDQHTSAARTDVQFAMKWPRAKRSLIPEVVLYHLESEDAQKGANWNGRQTMRFGVEGELRPAVAAARAAGDPASEAPELYGERRS
jgi:hypothetical protein